VSQENVETIRTVFEVFNREGFEATVPFLTPDTVWYPFPEWPGDSEYHGPAGARRQVAEWTENFDDYRWEVDDVIESGEAVVLLARHTGRIKGAGTRVEQRISAVFTDFDGEGRTGRAWFFLSWEEAREKADSL